MYYYKFGLWNISMRLVPVTSPLQQLLRYYSVELALVVRRKNNNPTDFYRATLKVNILHHQTWQKFDSFDEWFVNFCLLKSATYQKFYIFLAYIAALLNLFFVRLREDCSHTIPCELAVTIEMMPLDRTHEDRSVQREILSELLL